MIRSECLTTNLNCLEEQVFRFFVLLHALPTNTDIMHGGANGRMESSESFDLGGKMAETEQRNLVIVGSVQGAFGGFVASRGPKHRVVIIAATVVIAASAVIVACNCCCCDCCLL
jgi:hypothetical protein